MSENLVVTFTENEFESLVQLIRFADDSGDEEAVSAGNKVSAVLYKQHQAAYENCTHGHSRCHEGALRLVKETMQEEPATKISALEALENADMTLEEAISSCGCPPCCSVCSAEGEMVELDGTCCHGFPSLLIVMSRI